MVINILIEFVKYSSTPPLVSEKSHSYKLNATNSRDERLTLSARSAFASAISSNPTTTACPPFALAIRAVSPS
jgi:hypothetical protein